MSATTISMIFIPTFMYKYAEKSQSSNLKG